MAELSISKATADANPVTTVADPYSESPAVKHEDKHKPGKAESRYDLDGHSLLLPDGVDRQWQDSDDLKSQNYREKDKQRYRDPPFIYPDCQPKCGSHCS